MQPNEDRHPIDNIPQNSVVYAIAKFIFDQAPRQNWTIAVVAALAFWAGIVGRNVNVLNQGLNLYILFVAGTGRGKEAMASGISKLIEAVAVKVPSIRQLVTGRFASSQAILHHLSEFPGTLSIQGEGEYLFRRLTSPKAPQNEQELLQTVLDLFHKSGLGQAMPGYRKAEKAASVGAIPSPCFTLLTESTFGAVDALLSNDAVKKGVTPRFMIVMTKALRPELNPNMVSQPDPELVEFIGSVWSQVMTCSKPLVGIEVKFDNEANKLQAAFDRETTRNINEADQDIEAELWNRSHIKASKLAALVATGVNYWNPQITGEQMRWAIEVERYCVGQLIAEIESGEVGEVTEDVRLSRVIKACAEYVLQREPWLFPKGYRVDPELHDDRIITFAYLHNKLCNTKPFKEIGYKKPSQLIRECLTVLTDKGDLQFISKAEMERDRKRRVEGWVISNPGTFGIGL
jgi:hypothetical protein